MKKRNALAALALAVATAMGSAACGDDDGGGGNDAAGSGRDDGTAEHSRDDYVALMGGGAEGLTDEQANCVSATVVDAVGVDALEQANAWDQILDDPDGSLADYGVVVSEAQVTAIADGVGTCVDLPRFFEEMFVAEEDLSPELASCLASGLDEATLQQVIAVTIVEGEAAVDADPTFTADVEQAAVDCAAQGIT